LVKKIEEKQPREYTRRQLSHAKKQALRQKIYLFSGIAIIVAVILLTLSGWLFGEYLPYHKTIATVYDTKITENDLIDTLVVYGSSQSGIDIEQNLDYILSSVVQNVLVEKEAAKLGISVSEQEISDAVQGTKLNNARKAMVRASLLTEKLREEYFNKQVADSGNQVLMNAMLVESEELVPGIRDRLLSGDNFTTLAEQYAVNVVSKNNKGVFDWHPQTVLTSDISTALPVDWAFSENVKKGDISEAISDNVSSKQLGYWLIRLNAKPEDTGEKGISANVSALLLSSQAEALRIKAQLEAGDSLAALADTYSQYSPSQQGHGELMAAQSDNISTNFNNYAFNPETQLGKWSDPIKEDRFYTKGGAWIVQIVDKSNEHPYSTDDKSTLVDTAYSDWVSNLWLSTTTDIKYTLDDPDRQLAVERAKIKIKKASG
jgi:hypothetical protein